MKKLLISLLLLATISIIQAQDYHRIDSLKKALSTAVNDTNKVKTYFKLGRAYQWSKPDSALLYAMPGLALAKELNSESWEYAIILPVSEALSMKGHYSKALEFRFRSLELAKRLNSPVRIANALALTGLVYFHSKDYPKALDYYYQAKATNAIDIGGPQFINGFIGLAYFHLNQMDSAFVYIQRAYELDVKDTNLHWSPPYQYLAAIYEQKGNLEKAIGLYKESFAVSVNAADRLKDYNGIASVYKKAGRMDSAMFYSKKAIEEGTAVSMPVPVIEASAFLVDIYKSINNTDSAFKYQELLLAAKDSLFSQDKVRQMQNITFDEQMRQQEIEAEKERYRNKTRLYALVAALAVFIVIGTILWRNNQNKQRANALLSKKNDEVEKAYEELKTTQAQLVQREKMASLGELTAGIAHEIQNPLNFVNNFSEVSNELIDELNDELDKGAVDEAKAIGNDIKQNLEKINYHGKRADGIVKGMLQHSGSSSATKEPTDINKLTDEYVRLAYHGLRAKDKNFNADFTSDFDEAVGKVNIVPQDIGRVLLNLLNNAFYAVSEKRKTAGSNYKPQVSVNTKKIKDKVEITVADNGNGIPQNIVDKIFQPFFTTKPTGQGTGLGLSLAYDIVKAHGGKLDVETSEGEGTKFYISLPTD